MIGNLFKKLLNKKHEESNLPSDQAQDTGLKFVPTPNSDDAVLEKIKVERLERHSKIIFVDSHMTDKEFNKLHDEIDAKLPILTTNAISQKGGGKPKTKIQHSGLGSNSVENCKKLNFSSDFVEYVKKGNPFNYDSILLKSNPNFKQDMGAYAERIRKAVKFILPDDGKIIETSIKKGTWKEQYSPYIRHFKLPYESVIFEINFHLQSKKYVISNNMYFPLIFLCDQKDDHIEIMIFYRNKNRFWLKVNEHPLILKDNFSSPYMRNANSYTGNKECGEFLADMGQMAAHITLDFIAAINCSNIEISDTVKADERLNKLRLKKGKQPLFDYKLLTLGFTGEQNLLSEQEGEKRSAMRMHLRRGHIRRLKDRTIWVNACTVGKINNGSITKDYKVKPHTASLT